MSDNEVTKSCIACFKEIDSRASKCPHCQSLQSRLVRSLPGVLYMLLAVLALGAAYLILLLAQQIQGQNTEITRIDVKSSIEVLHSQLGYSDMVVIRFGRPTSPEVHIVGKLRNNGKVVADRIKLQVDCFDGDGKMIDTLTQTVYDCRPGETLSFKVIGERAHEKVKYASHKIMVRRATSADPPSD